MDKIAIISDIHGNLEALKSVLDDIKKRNITKIYCLGDIIAKGANQKECLDLIRENCEVIIQGNCDLFFSSDVDLEKETDINKERFLWNKTKITDEDRDFLRSLPYCHEFYMSGSLIRLFHATPESICGFVGDIDFVENKKKLFMPSKNTISNEIADIVICGHIHVQSLSRMYNRTILNPGSVGNPIDVIRNDEFDGNILQTTRANYMIIKGNLNSKNYDDSLSYEFVNLSYDIDKEIESNVDTLEKEAYITELKYGRYRDMEKINKSFIERNIDYKNF
ncbi:MAG: metallophosphoesterase family protein [Bacilli bacterium]|nr:metallophosphoesterase family protein [Bacilli bacterium]